MVYQIDSTSLWYVWYISHDIELPIETMVYGFDVFYSIQNDI